MNLGVFQKELEETFRRNGFESPELESAYIVSEITGIPYVELPLFRNRPLTPEECGEGRGYLARRLKKEPFQYIFGWTQFRFLDLKIGPGALIPRPETELLPELLIRYLPAGARVCELGTGSGAISLALASERPDLEVRGSEVSVDAFRWSERNLAALALPNVRFFRGSLFEPFGDEKFDAVVANLPYISHDERDSLPENVRDYEPPEALFAGDGGFALIERALLEAPAHLRERSALFFEIGEAQGERALSCALRTGFFTKAEVLPDQYGVPRFLAAYREAQASRVLTEIRSSGQ